MRFIQFLLPLLVVGVLAFSPAPALAADATFFGPIIPDECHCEGRAPDFGCVLVVIQNTMNLIISIGVIMFVLIVAYAGVLFITSPANPHNREMGRTIMLNAVIGLVIVLSSWLLVDFVMKILYKPSQSGQGVAQLGPWNSILTGTGEGIRYCLEVKEPQSIGNVGAINTGAGTGTTTGSETGSCTNCVALAPEVGCAAQGCQVASTLKTKLAAISASATWTVTEGYPPSRSHRAACHRNGTCVDVAFRPTNYNVTNVVNFIEAAQAQGLRAVFETVDCSLRDAVKARGKEAFCRADGGGFEAISGTHFSVYQ